MVKTVLKIEGMACGMCESHVNDAVRRVAKVKKVTSSHKKGSTEIISDEALDTEAIKAEIEKTGYVVHEISSEPYEKKGLFGLFK